MFFSTRTWTKSLSCCRMAASKSSGVISSASLQSSPFCVNSQEEKWPFVSTMGKKQRGVIAQGVRDKTKILRAIQRVIPFQVVQTSRFLSRQWPTTTYIHQPICAWQYSSCARVDLIKHAADCGKLNTNVAHAQRSQELACSVVQ